MSYLGNFSISALSFMAVYIYSCCTLAFLNEHYNPVRVCFGLLFFFYFFAVSPHRNTKWSEAEHCVASHFWGVYWPSLPLRCHEQNLIAILSLPALLAFITHCSKISQKKNGGAVIISLIRADYCWLQNSLIAFPPSLPGYQGSQASQCK